MLPATEMFEEAKRLVLMAIIFGKVNKIYKRTDDRILGKAL